MAIITAASLAQADVQAAIDASSVGDTILMPAGTADWTTKTYGGANRSGIGGLGGRILKGAGVGLTVITDKCATTTGYGVISVGTGSVEISDFTMIQDDTLYSENLIICTSTTNVNIHNISLSNIIRRGIHFYSATDGVHCTGVIHNSTLTAKNYAPSYGGGAFQLVAVEGPDNNNSSTPPDASTAAGSLAYAPGFGTDSAIFIEDSTLSQDAQGDSTVETYYGGKVVVRNNTCTNLEVGVHGRDSSVRTGHIIEVYRNIITNNIGTSHIGTVVSRGGSGVVWGNTITQTANNGSSTSSNNLFLQDYRAAGNLNADYTLRFPYYGEQNDGHSPYDGNQAIISGTHTGSNGDSSLTDGTKSWTTDQLAGLGDYATDNTLQAYYLWNTTTGAGGRVTANTATTATVTLTGGTRQTFNSGDAYILTYGYPGLDQNGWAGPTVLNGVQSTQVLTPWYSWDNTFNGTPDQLPFSLSYMTSAYTTTVQPDSSYFIQENREYYNATQKPDYTPYAYPHPLRGLGAPSRTKRNPATVGAGF